MKMFYSATKSKIRCFTFEKKERLQFALWGEIIFTVVKTAFQRRKTMRNSLKTMNLSDSLRRPIFDLRPEQLDVAQFIELTQKTDGI
jgi:16S rRNA (adenine1518-N6/adenine1519-N6)-dimethyltransferase